MLDSYRGRCLLNVMILPNCDKLVWVVPFVSGFAVHVLLYKTTGLALRSPQELWDKRSTQAATYPYSHFLTQTTVYETPPSKLGEGVGLYFHAPKFKVSHCLLVDIGAGKGMYSQCNEGH